MGRVLILLICCAIGTASAFAKDKQEYKADPLAVKFGSLPDVSRPRLSPDGSKVFFLKRLDLDVLVGIVLDLKTTKAKLVIASKNGEFDVEWCDWANETRLLCGLRGLVKAFGIAGYFPETRVVAVNADGSHMKVLLQQKLRYEFAQYQDRVVDWLVDDPDYVLIQIPVTGGSGVSRLNIYTGRTHPEAYDHKDVYDWLADGHGVPRLYHYVTQRDSRWFVRTTEKGPWRLFRESLMSDVDDHFTPVGFGANENELLYFDIKDGRLALWAKDVSTDEKPHIVFARDDVDVDDLLTLGKFKRLVAVGYTTDRPHWEFFDKSISAIHAEIAKLFPGDGVDIVDQSWDGNFYLIAVGGPEDSGTLYRLDWRGRQLLKLASTYPRLSGTKMAPVEPRMFKARDGIEVPGYLTLPAQKASGPLPTVVFPHGGPEARDVASFDPIVQFLAASGYAVLQVNFRGSGGYGRDWAGTGGFQNWRQAISDITDSAKSLIAEGVSDPSRICVVGWSYGGYAALMSAIEQPDLYKCVVSIAGVTDPERLVRDYRGYLNRRTVAAFVGHGEDVLKQGSPQERAAEIKAPALLFQGEKDVNLSAEEGREMAEKLDRAGASYQYIEYEDVEHDIRRNQYRIDMLSRIGEFLDRYIGAGH